MGIEPAHPTIRRHFVTVNGERQVHYRRAGKGPVVILLHQSPTSSREHVPLIERLMGEFTVIAPDTPGNGLSDPLPGEQPLAEEYAHALAQTLDALGIERCGIFGTHTGGVTATEFGRLYPDRASVVIVDGITCWTEAERADALENYFTPFAPRWDGGHLTWLWSRMREQTIFFPWYAKTLAARMDYDVPSPDRLHQGLLEFLRAGDEYRKPYKAAFIFKGEESIPALTCPAHLMAIAPDVLFEHFDRLPPLPDNIKVERFGNSRRELLDRAVEVLRQYPGQPTLGGPEAPKPTAGLTWQDYASVDGGQLHMRRSGGAGRPVLVQHDAASDNNVVRMAAEGFVGKRPVIAFDLPGNGESDNTIGTDKDAITCTTYAEVSRQALASMGLDSVDYVGTWGSGFTGLELAKMQPGLVEHLVVAHPIYHPESLRRELLAHYTPKLETDWWGGYLLMAWHAMRDQGLFWPWYNRTREGVLPREPYVDTAMVHRRVVSLLKCWNMWQAHYSAHWKYDAHTELGNAPIPVALASAPDHPGTAEALKDHSALQHATITTDMTAWSDALLPFLES